jgi:DNA polymerase-3 subunit gamma/tau
MVLIRIAHTADLPAPDEIIKALGGKAPARGASSPAHDVPPPRRDRPPLNAQAGQPPAARHTEQEPPPHPGRGHVGPDDGPPDEDRFFDGDYVGEADEMPTAASRQRADPRSFQEVVDLVGEKRDARLKVHLEDNVSLVKFDPAGTIDLYLLPGAPPEIPNDLREKLIAWTGKRWMVAVSRTRGEPPLGEVRRRREAAEMEALKAHPAVKAVLDEFPGAKIASVTPLRVPREDDTGTG